MSIIFLGYLNTDHAIFRRISIRYLTKKFTTSSSVSAYATCVLVRFHVKACNKSICIQIDRRKRTAYCTVFGDLHGHQFDAIGRVGSKLPENSEHVTCSISRLARRHARHARQWGRKRCACHVTPRLRVTKGRELDKVLNRKHAWIGQEKEEYQAWCFPHFFGAVPTYTKQVCLQQEQNIKDVCGTVRNEA